MNMKQKTIAAAVAICMVWAASAQAGGFIADVLVRPWNPDLARKLDDAHARIHNPLDHAGNVAAGIAAEALVPGSGPAVTGALEAGRAAK
jgi:hypothetical protein